MAKLNDCKFIGRLGRDPEIRYMPSGEAMANFTIACDSSFKGKDGAVQERTEWVRIVVFGKRAEVAGEYLKKGSEIYVSGRFQTRKWQNKEGVDQYTTEIVANDLQMFGGRSNGNHASEGGGNNQRQTAQSHAQSPAPAPAQNKVSQDNQRDPFADFEDDGIPY